MSKFLSVWLGPALLLGIAYLAAFFVTFSVLMPAQTALFPAFASAASLFFLPHSVRVIGAWAYGWRSAVLIAPTAFATHLWLFGAASLGAAQAGAVLAGILCAPLAFWLMARVNSPATYAPGRRPDWTNLILAGGIASVINSAGTMLFYGHDAATASAYFLGDMTGLVLSLVGLMLVFRRLRRRAR